MNEDFKVQHEKRREWGCIGRNLLLLSLPVECPTVLENGQRPYNRCAEMAKSLCIQGMNLRDP